MTPLTFDFMQTYFDKASGENSAPNANLWDEGVIYDVWEGSSCGDGVLHENPEPLNAAKCYGMRYEGKYGNNPHGIVRTEWNNGTVEEGTWFGASENPAIKNGLNRLIVDGRVFLQMFTMGMMEF